MLCANVTYRNTWLEELAGPRPANSRFHLMIVPLFSLFLPVIFLASRMTFVMGFKAGSDSVWVRDQGTIKESLRLEYTMSVCFCCGISYDLNGFKTFLFWFAIRIMWRRRLSEYIAELVGRHLIVLIKHDLRVWSWNCVSTRCGFHSMVAANQRRNQWSFEIYFSVIDS